MQAILQQFERSAGNLYFEDSGIDYVMVDESHNFKSFPVNSAISEATNQPSGRAIDLKQKIDYINLQRNPGRAVLLSTGTPVNNKLAELHTVFRYLNEQGLKDMGGLQMFDRWRSMFATVESRFEMDPKGAFKTNSRLSYTNLPLLQDQIWENASIVTDSDLDKYVTRPKVNYQSIVGDIDLGLWDRFMGWLEGRHADITKTIRSAPENKPRLPSDNFDTFLQVAKDNRVFSVDPRFVDDTLPEQLNSLMHKTVEVLAENYPDGCGYQIQQWQRINTDSFH